MSTSLDDAPLVTGPPATSGGAGLLLIGDLGGTKTALALVSADRGPRAPLLRTELPSSKYSSLGAMVREFLEAAGTGVEIRRACFAVAGPVIGGRAHVTNLGWSLAEADLAAELRIGPVHLLNDLEAIALATSVLEPGELHILNQGVPVPGGSMAVIAPGTGLGEAFLTWDGARYRPFPSEGGHADFAPSSEQQAGLLAHLTDRFAHVSVERVCSGPGILRIYDYLRNAGGPPESDGVARALAAGGNEPGIIAEAALRSPDPDPLSRDTLELFVSILGAEAGNLALKVLATGGVYLAGGIPMRLLPALEDGRFLRAFVAKGRMSDLLSRMPVRVVTRRAALLGAALRGFHLAETGTS